MEWFYFRYLALFIACDQSHHPCTSLTIQALPCVSLFVLVRCFTYAVARAAAYWTVPCSVTSLYTGVDVRGAERDGRFGPLFLAVAFFLFESLALSVCIVSLRSLRTTLPVEPNLTRFEAIHMFLYTSKNYVQMFQRGSLNNFIIQFWAPF